MKCKLSCMIATAFIGGSMYIMLRDKSIHKEFKNLLDDKQKKIYKDIKYDRFHIYMNGSLFAIAFSLFYRFFSKDKNPVTVACMASLIFSATQYFYYTLHPKRDWMVKHLKGKKQIEVWLRNYKIMKFRWHYGMLLGIIGYGLINYVIQSNIITFQK